MQDRIPGKPNRKKITYEDGTIQYATVEYADEPIEEGTPVNRALLMPMQRKQEIARYTNSGTWTVPTGITSVDVYVVGGGGGGCTSGGGGGYCKLYRDVVVTPGEQVAIQIGAGGAAGNPAGNGGQSYFKNLSYAANGGLGGKNVNSRASAGGNGGCGGGAAYISSEAGGNFGGDGGAWGGAGSGAQAQANAIPYGGLGGGNIDYTPVNPYDQIAYGCGGGGWPGGRGGGCGGSVVRVEDEYNIYARLDPGFGGGGGGGLGNDSSNLDSAATNGGFGGGGGGGHYRLTLAGNGGSGIVIIYG